MKEILRYSGCFVCGEKNERGLKAKFFYDGSQAFTDVVADETFEGYKSIFHGGITATLLDEVMIKALLARDTFAVTAEMTVRFHAPIQTGDAIRFSGWMTKQKGRIFYTEGTAVGGDGRKFASANGTYVEAKQGLREHLLTSID
ncbi:MAG: PaaI family thioesterase [Candidatus Zixiibacteriota bacterium]